ncbi:hypothetical protein [Rufibacter roseus]|uniref:DUF4352 domain-containing protein n=1 Tax=Rufibacter roseus TaxID=1567108 RepID=A0ABW2DR51_9BACT|nr:hypothetical protein [Rufibacter roseus]
MKQYLLIIALLIFFTSCNSPLDKKYNKATMAQDLDEIKKSEKLDSSEMMILGFSFVASELGNTNLEGKTYKQILEEGKQAQKELESQQKKEEALAAQVQLEENQRIEKLNKTLVVSMYDKGFEKYDYEEYITYKFAFQNNADKPIRAFKGMVVFQDIFGTEIKSLNLTYDEGVPAGKTIKYDASTEYNQFIDEDKLLRSKNLKDIKVVWKPEKILFEDGSTME